VSFSGSSETRVEYENCFLILMFQTVLLVFQGNKSLFYQTCCAGGYLSRRERIIPTKFGSRWLAELLVEKLTQIILSKLGKCFILLIYFLYISSAIFGLTTLQVGLKLKNLVPYDSYVNIESDIINEHFSAYGTYATVVIDEQLEYRDPLTFRRLEDLYSSMTSSDFTGPGEFWLIDFLKFNVTRQNLVPGATWNFIEALDDFLQQPK